jgi:hypothetical protein
MQIILNFFAKNKNLIGKVMIYLEKKATFAKINYP